MIYKPGNQGGLIMNLKPLEDRVIVETVDSEEVTASGIYLPDSAQEKPQRGKVIAVGDGRLDKEGKRIPLDVKKGDVVIYSKYGGTEVKIEGNEVLILKTSDILAKVVKK
jgi:chaperonin GroES